MRIEQRISSEPTRHLGTSMPIDWREDPSIPAAIFVTVFGGFAAGFSMMGLHAVLTGGRVSGNPTAVGIAATVFLVVGLTILLAGINAFFLRTAIRIDGTKVRYKRTALIWGAADWSEPLSAFRGVQPTEKYRSGGKDRASYTEYKIHLKHARDPKRDIELYRSRNGSRHRSETEGFAQLLGLPVLTEQEDGTFQVRETADLDKTVRERAEEGGLDAPAFDPFALPQDSTLKVRGTQDGYVFEASMGRGLPMAAIFLAAGLALLYWYYGPGISDAEGSAWIAPVVGGLSVLLGLRGIHSALFRVERLEVSRHGVRIGQVPSGSSLGYEERSSLRASEIEEVGLRKDRYGRFRLSISADRRTLTWGTYLSNEERGLVRDAILSALTR